jgi:hypothetical protein
VEGEPGTGIKEELSGCIRNVDGVCVVRGSIDPVVLDGGTTALPSRVLGGGDPEAPLSGDPQSLAGA